MDPYISAMSFSIDDVFLKEAFFCSMVLYGLTWFLGVGDFTEMSSIELIDIDNSLTNFV